VKFARFEPSAIVPEGFVTRSSPGDGQVTAAGVVVKLYVSSGPGLTMPDFLTVSTLEADAVLALNNLGVTTLTVMCSFTFNASDPNLGRVVAQFPAAGIVQAFKKPVTLTILKTSCP